MAGGYKITIQGICTFQQRTPFDMCIAEYTRVGRTACHIFFYKVIDNMVAKFIAYIQHIMRETMLYRRLTGIVKRIEVAATCFLLATACRGIIPCLHSNAYHLIP